jgi:uncharacterized protein (TIGR03118 family)
MSGTQYTGTTMGMQNNGMQNNGMRNNGMRNTGSFVQTNLVSDGSVPAANTDSNLVNAWGLAASPTGPFWVADNGTGVTTLYDGAGNPTRAGGNAAITIAAPPGQTSPAAPSGEVFNGGGGFDISSGGQSGSSAFIFATEDGTISGWNPTVNAGSTVLAVDNSNGGAGAVYKGLALSGSSNTGGSNNSGRLYAANFRSGQVEVYNSNFNEVNSFTDPTLPAGYAPFNVAVLNGNVFVTFALQNAAKHDDVAGAGNGFIDEFSLNGTLERRVDSNTGLDSPWGMTIAPQGFGNLGGDLLVGNFGDGTISIFNPRTDAYLGKLNGPDGKPITIDGLWSLMPGNGGTNSDPNSIYFTAGPNGEQDGLFGKLTASAGQSVASVSTRPGAAPSMANTAQSMANPSPGLAPSTANTMQSMANPGLGSAPLMANTLQSMANLVQSTASFGASTAGSAGMGASLASVTAPGDPRTLAINAHAHA